jgi:hypothetical protein
MSDGYCRLALRQNKNQNKKMNVRQLQSEINSAYQNLRFNNKKLLGFLEQFVSLLDFDLVEDIKIREVGDHSIEIKITNNVKFAFSENMYSRTRDNGVVNIRNYDFINNSTLCVRNFIKELNLHEEKRD